MTWIKLDDGVFAETAAPDPRQILDVDGLQQIISQKNMEIAMYSMEITELTARKEALQSEVDEIILLLEG